MNVSLNISKCNRTEYDWNSVDNFFNGIDCNDNLLTEIILNENIKYLKCDNNLLTEIICNENLISLICDNNLLTEIICNENLTWLNCRKNKIKHIKINENLETILCDAITNLDDYFYNENLEIYVEL